MKKLFKKIDLKTVITVIIVIAAIVIYLKNNQTPQENPQTSEEGGLIIETQPEGTQKSAEGTTQAAPKTSAAETAKATEKETTAAYVRYHFRNQKLLKEHFEKHGKPEMGFKSAEDYEKAASDVINNPDALHKTEKDDGDFVYYVVASNEFVVLSKDGYIRTYFNPSGGKAYYDRQ